MNAPTIEPNSATRKPDCHASNLLIKHFTRGVANPNTKEILKCNKSIADFAEDGSGGGVLKSLEVIADAIIENEQAEDERKKE